MGRLAGRAAPEKNASSELLCISIDSLHFQALQEARWKEFARFFVLVVSVVFSRSRRPCAFSAPSHARTLRSLARRWITMIIGYRNPFDWLESAAFWRSWLALNSGFVEH